MLLLIVSSATCCANQHAAAMANQVVLFTGFSATPGTGTGMDILNAELATIDITDYEGQVFAWNNRQSAFDWVQQFQNDRSTLVLIGHSFGGNAALQLADDFLLPIGVDVDLTIQVDPVKNFDSGANDLLPPNVDVGFNYYQISTGFFEPQGEDIVQGATNFNVEVLFSDDSITHTSIDNDPRLHALIGQNILENLNVENADFDSTGLVNGADFLIWQKGFGATGSGELSTGDANNDGDVNDEDLLLWQQQYGNSIPPLAALHTAAEPHTLTLLGGMALASLITRSEISRGNRTSIRNPS